MTNNKITIIVPIYADWPSIQDCIAALKKYSGTVVAKIMLVNDCGPEVDLIEKNIKQSIKDDDRFEYFRNAKNLGFVSNCNNAVYRLDKTDNDVMLLNCDTKVTDGFAEELMSVLQSSKKIGAVSPRSNNATICTLPLSAIKQKGIDPKKSYELFQKYKAKFPRYNQVPTAHGFCILIRRELIKKYGLFDPAFGQGYGEEVDFCQRIIERGWISVLSNRSYVFHLEAKSFSLETKQKLLEQHNKIIQSRYPSYKKNVDDYIKNALSYESKIFGALTDKKINQKLKTTIRKLFKRSS